MLFYVSSGFTVSTFPTPETFQLINIQKLKKRLNPAVKMLSFATQPQAQSKNVQFLLI
jgi:hypothetical protein